jgi:hypothetical protein
MMWANSTSCGSAGVLAQAEQRLAVGVEQEQVDVADELVATGI